MPTSTCWMYLNCCLCLHCSSHSSYSSTSTAIAIWQTSGLCWSASWCFGHPGTFGHLILSAWSLDGSCATGVKRDCHWKHSWLNHSKCHLFNYDLRASIDSFRKMSSHCYLRQWDSQLKSLGDCCSGCCWIRASSCSANIATGLSSTGGDWCFQATSVVCYWWYQADHFPAPSQVWWSIVAHSYLESLMSFS